MVGAQRSGTTLLRLLLDAHPRLRVGPETGFVRSVGQMGGATAPGRGTPWHDGFDLTQDEIEQQLADAYSALLARDARSHGARRWGEKTPVHRYEGERIQRLFPDAYVIAVVRHPVPVARSRTRWEYPQQETLVDWAASIANHHDDAVRFGPRRFRLVRYENLLADPGATMRALLRFLGERFDEDVLRFHTTHDPTERTDGGTVPAEPLDPARALSWTHDATPEELELARSLAGEQMAAVGYRADAQRPVVAVPTGVFTARGRLAAVGSRARGLVAEQGAAEVVRQAGSELRRRGVVPTLRRLTRRG